MYITKLLLSCSVFISMNDILQNKTFQKKKTDISNNYIGLCLIKKR